MLKWEASELCWCRSRSRDQDEVIAKLKRQLTEAETKIQQQAREFEAYKSQLRTKPEVQLQADINLLTLEKVFSSWHAFWWLMMCVKCVCLSILAFNC